MKFSRFFSLFLALFALVTLFSGCDALPFGDDGNNTNNNNNNNDTDTKPNGNVFYNRQAPDGNVVFLSIYSSTSAKGKFIAPKDGDNYALAVMTPDKKDGSFSYSGTPNSIGTISVGADGKLTFKPTTAGHKDGIGSISGSGDSSILTMETVPGFPTYKNLTLAFNKEDVISSSKPFGSDITLPNIDDDDDDDNPGVIDGPRDPEFKPGSYVTNVKFKSGPTFQSIVYEGDKVSFTATVDITYKDGSTTPNVTVDENNFVIDPPYYTKSGDEYTLKYIGEYSGEETYLKFTGPKDDTSTTNKTYFYKLTAQPTVTGEGTIKYFEGYGFDLSEVTITGKYKNIGNQEETKQLYKYATLVEADSTTTVTLSFGDTTSANGKKENVPFDKNSAYYTLSGITILDAAFDEQITFDDPRFFPNTEDAAGKEAKAYWLSHLSDAKIGLSYKNTTIQKELRVVDAAMNLVPDTEFELTTPADWSNKVLTFKYGKEGDKKEKKLEIPLYDTLAGVAIENKSSSRIILNGTKPDDETSFLKQVDVYATYTIGNNINNTVRKPVYVGPLFSAFNDLYINGNCVTNVNKTDGILNSSSSNSYNKNGKLQKAMVTVTAYQGSDTDKSGTPQSVTGVIEVGVTGY